MPVFRGLKASATGFVPAEIYRVDNPTEAQCIQAVQADPDLLRHASVKHTRPVIEAALAQDGCALRFVRPQASYMVAMAIDQNPEALQYAHNQTLEACRQACKLDTRSAIHIRNYQMWRETVYAKCFSAEAVVSAHRNQLLGDAGLSEVAEVIEHIFGGKIPLQHEVKAELEHQLPWLDGYDNWVFVPGSGMQFWLLPKELPE